MSSQEELIPAVSDDLQPEGTVGIQFYSITGIDASGAPTTGSKVGYCIYDDETTFYDFSTFTRLEDMAAVITPDTAIPYILSSLPNDEGKRQILRNQGCFFNGEFIDASTFNRRHYPFYVTPDILACSDLGTVPVEQGTLVAAIFIDDDFGSSITLRVRESAHILYNGNVYSSPSKYPVVLFRPLTSEDESVQLDMTVQKNNIYEIFHESDTDKTSIKVVADEEIPHSDQLFDFLFRYIDFKDKERVSQI